MRSRRRRRRRRQRQGVIVNNASNGHRSMTYLQVKCSYGHADTFLGGRLTYEHSSTSRDRSIVDPTSVDTLISMTLLRVG